MNHRSFTQSQLVGFTAREMGPPSQITVEQPTGS
jgi:hypothetical protein